MASKCEELNFMLNKTNFEKGHTICFTLSGFIQISGNNTIVQKKGDKEEGIFVNKTNIFSIQKDDNALTNITCVDDANCSLIVYPIQLFTNGIRPPATKEVIEDEVGIYSEKSYLSLSPVDAYVEKKSSILDDKPYAEMHSITYILPEEEEYDEIKPQTPCTTITTKHDKGKLIKFSFYYNAGYKRIFKKIEFKNKGKGKIREVPTTPGLHEFENMKEYVEDKSLYSEPYKCEAYTEYGYPKNGFPKFFDECNVLIYGEGETMGQIYLRTLKAKTGDSFCIAEDFMVYSEQQYYVELKNATERYQVLEASNSTQTLDNPFIVAPKQFSVKRLVCNDTKNCTFQFSFIENSYITKLGGGINSKYVALNKNLEINGILKYDGTNKRYLEKVDTVSVTYLTNKQFNIEIKAISGRIGYILNSNQILKDLNESNSFEFKGSLGTIVLVPNYKGSEIKQSKYSISLKLDENVKTSEEEPFRGGSFNGEINTQDPVKKGDIFQNEGTPDDKLNGGQIAGIVIGVLIVIAIICVLVWFFVFRTKSDSKGEEPESGSGQNV